MKGETSRGWLGDLLLGFGERGFNLCKRGARYSRLIERITWYDIEALN